MACCDMWTVGGEEGRRESFVEECGVVLIMGGKEEEWVEWRKRGRGDIRKEKRMN